MGASHFNEQSETVYTGNEIPYPPGMVLDGLACIVMILEYYGMYDG